MRTNFEGKLTLVTGAATGIGRATALGFAAEGARLALLDHDGDALAATADEARGRGVEVAVATADLSTAAGVADGLARLLGDGSSPDVLVNNVGAGSVRTFDDLTDDDWHATFELNFFSYLRTIRAVLPGMRARGSGVIVNNASDLARQPEANPVDYAASKAAVLALTKSLARAEGPAIRVNAVAPGPIWTPFWTKPGGFADTLAKVHGLPPQEAVEHEMKLRQLPLQRLGTAEEVANVVVFLASDLAAFVTSSVWGVDGGSVRAIV
ncbi:SDR family NAD(P)-dependent oxidoreductase [Conexibacter sp. CPCC 206217]|uniref:SDR family NAD(P)-dependent oxidoreductase n=1 Tax=Conexibacter sp. CPCC 206217 TaxID=3064574 RepID=UPI00272DA670|nr:SDR family NAD(P)-dependent oxidoreductase [Conexibacter sp. CPCC 206217]